MRQAIVNEGGVVTTVNWWGHAEGIPCGQDVGVGWRWDGQSFAPPSTAPDRVTPRQARIALALQPSPDPAHPTLLQYIGAGIGQLPEPDRTLAGITWEYATEVLRSDPLVAHIGAMAGMTEEQIDKLFIQAAAL